jgi:hypothetical protein
MAWGKHAGKAISTLPRSYLTWLRSRDDLDPHLAAAVRIELRRRGERHLDAGAVVGELEEAMTVRIAEDPELSHELAAKLCDHWLEAVEEVCRRLGIGEETELVIPKRSA